MRNRPWGTERLTLSAVLPPTAPASNALRRSWLRLIRTNRLLLLAVVLPTLIAATYFTFVASDVYISESRFVVRGSQQIEQPGLLGTLLQGTSLARSLDDTHAVHDYILSRDSLNELNRTLRLADVFKKRDIDFVNRFAALSFNESFESLYKYLQRRVSVDVDTSSSIAILRVNAFTAEDAKRINDAILSMSERFVNALSARARQDSVQFATAEVRDAERRAQAAALALAEFRTQKSVMDPERQSAVELQQISKIEDELIATKTEIAQLLGSSPKNPQLPALQRRRSVLESEINDQLGRITGVSGSLSAKSAGYMRVALERDFAEKQLAAAMTFLESARLEALRQQLYLERIVQPNLPDYAMEPRRLRSVLVVFVLGMMAWGVLSLLVAGIREHFA
jgi:capsular polysaccharide transport system permease protein